MHEPSDAARPLAVARNELILGGQKSGKSRRAEGLAQSWLAQSGRHHALFIATARGDDDEMRARISRHRADRALRVPALATLEEPLAIAAAVRQHSRADTLLVVDCLTLWLSNLVWPGHAATDAPPGLGDPAPQTEALLLALAGAPGPLVLVSNEIGLGVIPIGREVRAFCDALGLLNQQVTRACERVTLMVAGLPLALKAAP